MRLNQDTKLIAGQRLVMTPALRQAVEILQLSAIELSSYLQEQALQNPLLELVEDTELRESDADADQTEGATGPDADQVEEWLDYFSDSSDLGLTERPPAADRPALIEAVPESAGSLADHLRLQLVMLPVDSGLVSAAEAVIDALDDDGYLRVDAPDLAAGTGTAITAIEQAIAIVQSLEPAGVAARDLSECLMLQLSAQEDEARRCDAEKLQAIELAKLLVRDHLDDLAAARLSKLGQMTGASTVQISLAVVIIRELQPRPGQAFASGQGTRYIVPDAVIERVGGDYLVVLNDSSTPQLRINSYYRSLSAPGAETPGVSTYVAERLRAALWVLRCVEQRRATVYRVVEAIALRQREFLDLGVRHLRPMTLKDIAAEVGVHESTVSRAVANKYVQTPQGAYELRFFFTSALDSAHGTGQVSSASVKRVLRELIEAEDPRSPHSDQRLVELLHRRGADLSRRTVTKYRRELGVPSSTQRRRP